MSEQFATVNGSPISRFEFDMTAQGFAAEQYGKTLDRLTEEQQSEVKAMAEEKLVARELIFQAALSAGVVVEEEEVIKEQERIFESFKSKEALLEAMEQGGFSPPAFHRMVRKDLTVNLYSRRKAEEQLSEPTREEIETFYRSHGDQLVQHGRAHASHILIQFDAEGREEALERIQELRREATQENFAELARRHSQCPSAGKGGDLGDFRREQVVEPFAEAAFNQSPGEVGEVVETPFGFHLILVHEREEPRPLDLEEATPRIRNYLSQQASARLVQEWVEGMKAEADIRIPGREAEEGA